MRRREVILALSGVAALSGWAQAQQGTKLSKSDTSEARRWSSRAACSVRSNRDYVNLVT